MDQIWTPLAWLLWGVVGYVSLFVVLPVLGVVVFILFYPLFIWADWLISAVLAWRESR